MTGNENLYHLKASLEKISHAEDILLKLINHFPIGIFIVGYPSRKCLFMNELAQQITSPLLMNKAVYLHGTYLMDEEGKKYDCVKIGSYSFTVRENQYISLLIARQKEKGEYHGESAVRI